MKLTLALLFVAVAATCQQQHPRHKKSKHVGESPTPIQSEEFREAVKMEKEHPKIKLDGEETQP